MPPRSSTRLALIPLLLILVAAGWVLWPESPQGTLPDGTTTTEERLAAAPGLDGTSSTAQGSAPIETVERLDVVDPTSGASDSAALPYPPERDILVRAELTTLEGEQGHPPKDCEGWTVVAQTWIRETGEIARFTAISDEKGIAEFHFPDFVHVDWVTCLPPVGSKSGFSFLEEHEDLYPDRDYLALLHIQESHVAFGLVTDLQDRPVGGAVVHAFDQNWTYGLNDWTPGFLTATTDGAGIYRFEQLPPGSWVFAVEPEDWLMVEPPLNSQQDHMGYAEIDEGQEDPVDAGILKVVPMATLELRMTDADGNPVVGASLYVEPLALDVDLSPHLVESSSDPEPDPADIFLSDSRTENYFGDFPYSFYFRTDSSGRTVLRLLRGRYRMSVNPIAGMSEEGGENPEMEFHTDQESVHYRFPISIGDVRGRVLSPEGAPLLDAQVSLSWETHEGWEEVERLTDGNGSFQFQSVRLGGNFKVTVWPDDRGWLPADFDLSPSDMQEEITLTLRPATKLHLVLEMEILKDRVAHFKVLDFKPAADTSFDPDDYWWRQKQRQRFHLKRSNRVTLHTLEQGTYTVALFHSEQGYRQGEGHDPQMREIRRWSLSTAEPNRTLKVDWPR